MKDVEDDEARPDANHQGGPEANEPSRARHRKQRERPPLERLADEHHHGEARHHPAQMVEGARGHRGVFPPRLDPGETLLGHEEGRDVRVEEYGINDHREEGDAA